MKFSSLTDRIAADGADAWAVHYEGLARREAGEDILILSVGQESDESTPRHIVDRAIESLQSGRHHYTPVNGLPELRQAIVENHEKLTGQTVHMDQCAVFAGAQNALFAVAQCLLEHGDEVILIEPYYTTYPAAFTAAGANAVSVPAKAEDGFCIDPRAIQAQINERTRAIVLNSPNNPVGAVYSREQYQAVIELCRANDIWLISDEVYLEMLPPEDRISPAGLPGADSVCVTVSSLSKSHRMTGWRLGWVIGPKALLGHLKNLSMCMCYGLSPFIMDAGIAALKSDIDVAKRVRETLGRRRDIVVDTVSSVDGLQVFSASGGMFVVLDIRRLEMAGQDFAWELLNRYQVCVLPCDGFGQSGKGLLRLSLCISDEKIRTACHRIVEFAETIIQKKGSTEP